MNIKASGRSALILATGLAVLICGPLHAQPAGPADLKDTAKVGKTTRVMAADYFEVRDRALIEVRITPENEGGFDRIARRIRFDQLEQAFDDLLAAKMAGRYVVDFSLG